MRSTASCRVVRTTEELEGFVSEWSALWARDPQSTSFQSPEWLIPWWRQFGAGDLRAAVVSGPRGIRAFLPFYVYRDPASGQRQLMLVGVSTSDYLDGLFSPECDTGDVLEALNAVCDLGEFDSLDLSQLRSESKLLAALKVVGEPFQTEICSRMAAVPMAELPQKIKRNAMYYRNRAMRAGELEFKMADESNWAEAFDALVRMHSANWERRGEPGVLADPRVLAWHREALPRLVARGVLRLCSLRLNGEIIGVLYSLVDVPTRLRRSQYCYLTAYSNEHADFRPGTVLHAFAIEHAANEGIATIDMLRGNEGYKEIWHTERAPTYGFSLRANELARELVSAAEEVA